MRIYFKLQAEIFRKLQAGIFRQNLQGLHKKALLLPTDNAHELPTIIRDG